MLLGIKHSLINTFAHRWELFEKLLEIFYTELLTENYNSDGIDIRDEREYIECIVNQSLDVLRRISYEFTSRVPSSPFPKLVKDKRTNKIKLQKPIGLVMPNSEWEESDAYDEVDPRETYDLLRQRWESMLSSAQDLMLNSGVFFIAPQFPEFDEVMERADHENDAENSNSLNVEQLEEAIELLPFSFTFYTSKFLYKFTEHMRLQPEWAYVFYIEPRASKLNLVKSEWEYVGYKISIKRKSVYRWLNLPPNIEFNCEPILVKNVKLTLQPKRVGRKSCF